MRAKVIIRKKADDKNNRQAIKKKPGGNRKGGPEEPVKFRQPGSKLVDPAGQVNCGQKANADQNAALQEKKDDNQAL